VIFFATHLILVIIMEISTTFVLHRPVAAVVVAFL